MVHMILVLVIIILSYYPDYCGRSRVEYLDSPGTTGSITYSTEIALHNFSGNEGIVYVNYNDSGDNDGSSTILDDSC